MKKLYGYYGGSRMYGFPVTENSDWDYYSIGTSDKIKLYKIYPNIKLHQKKRTMNLDVEKLEIASFFTYLLNGFLFQVEALFVHKSWMDYLDPRFEELVLNKKELLIDRTRLVENIGCNIYDVRRKTVEDIRKLKSAVLARNPSDKIARGVMRMCDEYERKGYYHKDYLHNIRIAASVLFFLKSDIYPLRLGEYDTVAFEFCSQIKTNPDKFSRKELDDFLEQYLKAIDEVSLEDDEKKFRFDAAYAQKTLEKLYS